MSLFDERDLVEITSDVYPGERLCRNPLLDRARKRQELLEATEARTDCRSDTARQAPGRSGSGRSSAGWRSTSRGPSTTTVSSPVGVMRLRSLPRPGSSMWSACRRASSTVPRAYKRLNSVERAFRSLKDLKVRPVYPNPESASSCVCSPTTWHMRLKPMLFDDEDAEGGRPSWRRQKSRRAPGPRRQRRGRPEVAQLPHPHRRSCHPQHRGAPPCGRRTLPGHHTAHAAPEKGTQAPGREAIVYRDR